MSFCNFRNLKKLIKEFQTELLKNFKKNLRWRCLRYDGRNFYKNHRINFWRNNRRNSWRNLRTKSYRNFKGKLWRNPHMYSWRYSKWHSSLKNQDKYREKFWRSSRKNPSWNHFMILTEDSYEIKKTF